MTNSLQESIQQDGTTIQQKLFSGDQKLTEQNSALNKLMQENENILTKTSGEYEKVKTLLNNYSIVKEKLTDDYLRNTQKLQTKYSDLKRSNEDLLEKNNFIAVSLGKRILRTETAVVSSLSAIRTMCREF